MESSASGQLHALPPDERRAVCAIATTLRDAGHQAWLVGGCVRDLYMGCQPHDLDIATDAVPARIEELFERTVPVGRSFGTLIVLQAGGGGTGLEIGARAASPTDSLIPVEVTTFRSDGGYSDGRHPDEVTYVSSARIDAFRRDFTCNALYLDPLSGEWLDPCGGRRDIDDGRLRAVGDARARFEEDGLRLLRMARFEARLGFTAAAGLHETARGLRRRLATVSVERVLAELTRIFEAPGAARAIEILAECELLEACLPSGWSALVGDGLADRLRRLRAIDDPPGLAPALAVLFDPGLDFGNLSHAASVLARLRLSRRTRRQVEALWRNEGKLHELLSEGGSRAARLRVVRDPSWPCVQRLHRARLQAARLPSAPLERLAAWAEGLEPSELDPPPLLTSADLAELGLRPGPRWGQLLHEAEEAQLAGRLRSRPQALAWARRRATELRGLPPR